MGNTEKPSSTLFVPVEEAARRLGIGRTLTFRLIKDGRIRATKIGRRTVINVSTLAEDAARLAGKAGQ